MARWPPRGGAGRLPLAPRNLPDTPSWGLNPCNDMDTVFASLNLGTLIILVQSLAKPGHDIGCGHLPQASTFRIPVREFPEQNTWAPVIKPG